MFYNIDVPKGSFKNDVTGGGDGWGGGEGVP